MSNRSMMAAKTIAQSLNFNVTNLSLQKLIYLSHMFHLGRTGQPLIDGHFEAWDLGPVEPNIYHLLKAYGGRPIRDIFPCDVFEKGTPERTSIDSTLYALKNKTSSQLVQITHQNHGAWAKNYRSGIRSMRIPAEDIMEEYHTRRSKIPSPKKG